MQYIYRCSNCESLRFQTHSIKEDPRVECGCCGQDMYKVIRASSSVGVRIKNGGEGWQSGLARHPRDREAMVDGPRALQKLIDKRKREAEKRGSYLKVLKPSDVIADEPEPEPTYESFKKFLDEDKGA